MINLILEEENEKYKLGKFEVDSLRLAVKLFSFTSSSCQNKFVN